METYSIRNKSKTIDEIKREYKDIMRLHKSSLKSCEYCELGKHDDNQDKNRYEDVIPLKKTAVKLKRVSSDPNSEYINANFVQDVMDGVPTQRYISAQAPVAFTFGDFWRMTWEYNINLILMLTNLVEDGNMKAEIYWPRVVGRAVRYGDYIVLFKKEEIQSSQLVLRHLNIWCDPKPKKQKLPEENLDLSDSDEVVDIDDSDDDFFDFSEFDAVEPQDSEVRQVVQIHCTKWPDLGILNSCEMMEDIIKEVDRFKGDSVNNPILVHCSAGIGRTGTFIAIHTLLTRDKLGRDIDVKNCVLNLRSQRVGMVQSVNQYIFIYQILSHIINNKQNETTVL
jgi:protein tyrosine phosphatase